MPNRREERRDSSNQLLNRLRAGFFVLAVGFLLAAVANVLVVGTATALVKALVTVAAVGMGVHWFRGLRRGGFAPRAEWSEAAVLVAVLAAAAGHPALPLFAMLFRSMYGPPRLTVLRLALFCGGILAVYASKNDFSGQLVGHFVGLTVAGGLMQLLRDAVARTERSERRLRSVVENASDAVTIVTADGRIRWQSASIRGLLGREPSELEGQAFVSLVHSADVPEVQRHLADAGRVPGSGQTVTARLRHADGSLRWVEAAIGNLLHHQDVEGILLTLRDATERRRLEAEREALAQQRARDEARRVEIERLHERVEAERERQELEARLQRSQRLESVGLLAGGVAHDFNNLLAVILNYAAFIGEELPEDDALREDLREIEEAARRGAGLTRQLLLFAQRKVTHPQVLDLGTVIAEMLRLLDRSLGSHVELGYEAPPEPCHVEADPASLEQVVLNLVVNARDAVGPAGGRVTIALDLVDVDEARARELEVRPGPHVRLAVTDDGCGMDEATMARVMEPFFTTKPVGEGTGLGLATVYGVASQAGGGVSLRSQPGEGTTVEVWLPASADAAADRATAPADEVTPGGRRILVVEDEDSVRALVERILSAAGHEVVVAASGDRALALFLEDAQGFDLLLTDVVMPGMTGLELTARVHAVAPEQRVLLMSGYSRELLAPDRRDSAALLPKPFAADELRAAVHDALSSPAAAPATR